MNEGHWLEYLRKHPGRYEAANLLFDTIRSLPRQQAVDVIVALISAYCTRVRELMEG